VVTAPSTIAATIARSAAFCASTALLAAVAIASVASACSCATCASADATAAAAAVDGTDEALVVAGAAAAFAGAAVSGTAGAAAAVATSGEGPVYGPLPTIRACCGWIFAVLPPRTLVRGGLVPITCKQTKKTRIMEKKWNCEKKQVVQCSKSQPKRSYARLILFTTRKVFNV